MAADLTLADVQAQSDASENLWWVPDFIETPARDMYGSARQAIEDARESADVLPDLDFNFDLSNPLEAPASVLREGIRQVGSVLEIPADVLEDMIEEAGDSRDSLVEVFQTLLQEAGSTRDGVLSIVEHGLDSLVDMGSNALWVFVLVNLLVGGGALVALGIAAYFGGSKLESIADLGKLLGGK